MLGQNIILAGTYSIRELSTLLTAGKQRANQEVAWDNILPSIYPS